MPHWLKMNTVSVIRNTCICSNNYEKISFNLFQTIFYKDHKLPTILCKVTRKLMFTSCIRELAYWSCCKSKYTIKLQEWKNAYFENLKSKLFNSVAVWLKLAWSPGSLTEDSRARWNTNLPELWLVNIRTALWRMHQRFRAILPWIKL